MSAQELFQGFDKQNWEKALTPQNEYLKENYQYDMLANVEIDPQELNEKAAEAKDFMESMAEALRSQLTVQDAGVQKRIEAHLLFLQNNGTVMDAKAFRNSVHFLSQDAFHHKMMEDQQIGLSYFLLAAAEEYAKEKEIKS